MDKQRLLLFIALVIFIWGGTFIVQFLIAPQLFPPAPVAKAPANKKAAQQPNPGDKDAPDGKPAAKEIAPQEGPAPPAPGAKQPFEKTTPPAEKKPLVGKPAEKPAPTKEPPAPPPPGAEPQLVTLGSLDPASGYAMLLTLDSVGASVLRAELNSPRYRDLENPTGYLGKLHFTAEKSPVGLEVRLVGPGTPAAVAGLRAGDVLFRVGDKLLTEVAQLEAHLRTTKPGESLALGVRRQGKPGSGQELLLKATLAQRPLEIIRPVKGDPNSLLWSLAKVGDVLAGVGGALPQFEAPARYSWTLDEHGVGFAQFSLVVDDELLGVRDKGVRLKMVKRYELAQASEKAPLNQHLQLRLELKNLGEKSQTVAYRLDGPHGLPLEGWWYTTKLHPKMWYTAGARDVLARRTGGGHELYGASEIYKQAKTSFSTKPGSAPPPDATPFIESSEPTTLKYVGVDTQYFAVVLKPGQSQPSPDPAAAPAPGPTFVSGVARTVEPKSIILRRYSAYIRTTDVSFRLTTADQPLAAGASLQHDYLVFIGPKELELLGRYDLESCIEFGWSIFAWPARLLEALLQLLYAGVQNYGVAIILLTVIVRTCMIPISIKQAKNAALMQAMAPEMAEIRKRFPDDLTKQHELNQEVQSRYGVSPLSGCLPALIQMPILMGLYRAISTDIHLRDAPLIPGLAWSSNLAGPDQFFYWEPYLFSSLADEGFGWLGPYLNLFPLVTVALFLFQQKLFTPPAVDEQTQQQQTTMNIMMCMMALMFFKVPAGLCLYFITTTLWSIVERQLIPKPAAPGGGAAPEAPAVSDREADNRRRERDRKAKAKRK